MKTCGAESDLSSTLFINSSLRLRLSCLCLRFVMLRPFVEVFYATEQALLDITYIQCCAVSSLA